MRLLLLGLAVLGLFASGCHQRCEEGFLSKNGGCVSFTEEDSGTMTGTDATVTDLGPRPDGSPFDSGRDGGTTDTGGRDATPVDGNTPDSGGIDGSVPDGSVPGNSFVLRGSSVLPRDGTGPYSPGEVWVDQGHIGCIGPSGSCGAMAGSAPVIDTGAVILPGLVDAHNHVAYNWLPEWVAGRLFQDSVQWRGAADYDAFVAPYSDNHTDAASFCAMVQWGEIRALVNGTTTIFGTPQPRTCYRWLVRNVELTNAYNGFGADRVRSNTLGIGQVSMTEATALLADMAAGDVSAYMIHLSEGISTRAHDEFVDLMTLDLLQPQTVIIHGTALTVSDFDLVGAAGAKLVWSPSSNMALYGDTTNVQAAKQSGVSISLAPDWAPSGDGNDPLGELRYAKVLVEGRWPGLFTDEEYVGMITDVPAAAMGVDNQVGRLVVGQLADLLVLTDHGGTAYESIVESGAADIQLVVLDGVPTYGSATLLSQVPGRPATCFAIDACGETRSVCWADTPTGAVTPDSISTVIQGFYAAGPASFFDCGP